MQWESNLHKKLDNQKAERPEQAQLPPPPPDILMGQLWSTIWREFERALLHLDPLHNRLLWLLLLGDGILIGLYILHRIDFYFVHSASLFLKDARLSIVTEWGFGEIFQYCKELACVVLLVGMGIRRRQWGAFVWALLFFYLFLDDSIYIHEKLGALVTNTHILPSIAGIAADGLGQALISAAVGIPFVFALVLAHFKGDDDFRSFSWQMGFMLAALAFCGVAIDMLNLHNQSLTVRGMTTIFEDGGEMIVLSIAVAVANGWNS